MSNTKTNVFVVLFFVFLLIILQANISSAANKQKSIIVKNNLVSVDVKEMNLYEILLKISGQSSSPFIIYGKGEKLVTTKFFKLTLKEALDCLIQKNYAVMESSDGKILAVYFLSDNEPISNQIEIYSVAKNIPEYCPEMLNNDDPNYPIISVVQKNELPIIRIDNPN